MRTSARDAEVEDGAICVPLEAGTTDHFLRRLEERGGDTERLVWEGDGLARRAGFGRSTVATTASSSPVSVKFDYASTGVVAASSP